MFTKANGFADILQNRCSQIFRNICRKTPVLGSFFNGVAGLIPHENISKPEVCKVCSSKGLQLSKACNFIKKRLQHKCFLVNISKFLRKAFLQNTSYGCFFTWMTILLKDSQINLTIRHLVSAILITSVITTCQYLLQKRKP